MTEVVTAEVVTALQLGGAHPARAARSARDTQQWVGTDKPQRGRRVCPFPSRRPHRRHARSSLVRARARSCSCARAARVPHFPPRSYKARDRNTNETLALKKIRLLDEDEGVPRCDEGTAVLPPPRPSCRPVVALPLIGSDSMRRRGGQGAERRRAEGRRRRRRARAEGVRI